MFDTEKKEPWRGGVYLTTASSSFEADLFISKLEAEGIPAMKRYVGASNFIEISMGMSSAYPVEIYVPESALEEAVEVIRPVPIDDDFMEAGSDDMEAGQEKNEAGPDDVKGVYSDEYNSSTG